MCGTCYIQHILEYLNLWAVTWWHICLCIVSRNKWHRLQWLPHNADSVVCRITTHYISHINLEYLDVWVVTGWYMCKSQEISMIEKRICSAGCQCQCKYQEQGGVEIFYMLHITLIEEYLDVWAVTLWHTCKITSDIYVTIKEPPALIVSVNSQERGGMQNVYMLHTTLME